MIFDLGTTSVLKLKGAESLDLLHRISTNALAKLGPGAAAWTLFVTDRGRLIDHCLVLADREGASLLCSPGAAAMVRPWIEKYIIMEDVTVAEEKAGGHLVAIGGPGVLAGGEEFPQPGQWRPATIGGVGVLAVRAPFFGLDRTDLVVPGSGSPLVDTVLRGTAGVHDNAAWDEFRIERVIPAFGCEIVDRYNPLEVNLRGAVSFTKGCYVGQEVIARLDTYNKVQREPAAVVLPGGAPSGGPPLPLMREGEEVGALTSCGTVRQGGSVRGIAVLRRGSVRPGDVLMLGGTGGRVEVVALPQVR